VEVTDLIIKTARQLNDASIASLLNRLGHRTGKNQSWTELRVRSFRGDHHIAVYKDGEREERGELTLEQAAAALGVSKMTVLRMIDVGTLAASQACKGAPWVIKAVDLQRPEVQQASGRSPRRPLPENPQQIPLELQ
jgi:excisionase family DNA binding protein